MSTLIPYASKHGTTDTSPVMLIILFVVIGIVWFLIHQAKGLERTFKAEVKKELGHVVASGTDILTEEDIRHLPEPVQKYLRYANAVGKEKVRNFRVTFEGEFRTDPKKGWGNMYSEQYNDMTDTTRLFFMEMKMFGLPVACLHKYADAKATMLAKVAGLLTVVDGKGQEMNEGETVTVFNDMCLFAPASLIDRRIEWESIDSLTAKGTFNNKEIKVSALLYFTDKGELINFVSEDRSYSPTGKTYQKMRWSTPVKAYKDYNGVKICSCGEVLWSFPEGQYTYCRINVKEIKYNLRGNQLSG